MHLLCGDIAFLQILPGVIYGVDGGRHRVRCSTFYDCSAAAAGRAHQVQVESCQDHGSNRRRQQVTLPTLTHVRHR